MVIELSKEHEGEIHLRSGKLHWDIYSPKFDLKEGFKTLLRAAECENPEGMYLVGFAYLHGNRGVEKDVEKAYEWLAKAASAGNGEAQMLVAEKADEDGDIEAAIHWYGEAEKNGISMADERKRLVLIKKHHRNITNTFEWYKEGADLGIVLDCYRIGMMYFKGEGVPQNYQLAEQYLSKSSHAEGIDKERVSEALGDIYAFHLNDPVQSFDYYYSMGETILAKKVEMMRSKMGYFKRKKFDAEYRKWQAQMKQYEEYQKIMAEKQRDYYI